jgi:hypothetical protein
MRMRTTIRFENLSWCVLDRNCFWAWIIRIMTLWHRQILSSFERTLSFSSKSFRFEYRYDLNWTKWFFSFVTKVVSSTMMITLKIFMNFKLLSRVRRIVKDAANSTSTLSFNIKVLEKKPLLLSIYAETLRLLVQVFVTRCSSHTIVHINTDCFQEIRSVWWARI